MRINQNIMAFNSYRNLSATNSQLGKSLEKLSSGFRINRAADDAAGLVVSEGLRAQVSGLQVATRNAQDGTSVVQTAEGALTEVHSMLRRMRDLTLQASNTGANDQAARDAAQAEITQLTKEIERVATDTKFGQVALLDGGYGLTDATNSDTAAFVTRDVAGMDFATTPAGFNFRLGDAIDGTTVQVNLTANFRTLSTDAIANQLEGAIRTALNGVEAGLGDSVSVAGTINPANNGQSSFAITVAGGEEFTLAAPTAGVNALATVGWTAATEQAAGEGGLFQVGANAGETIAVSIGAMTASALGLGTGSGAALAVTLNVAGTDADRTLALNALDDAIEDVSTLRGDLGAIQNRFEHTIANLSVTAENLAASESRIRDTDMALELVSFTRHQILQQAGTAMLAQANSVPQSVLSLLR